MCKILAGKSIRFKIRKKKDESLTFILLFVFCFNLEAKPQRQFDATIASAAAAEATEAAAGRRILTETARTQTSDRVIEIDGVK